MKLVRQYKRKKGEFPLDYFFMNSYRHMTNIIKYCNFFFWEWGFNMLTIWMRKMCLCCGVKYTKGNHFALLYPGNPTCDEQNQFCLFP